MRSLVLLMICFAGCRQKTTAYPVTKRTLYRDTADKHSWVYFLQHLPESSGDILDYRGVPISDQAKHYSIISYDVGKKDLQQCADALVRLRAEYLFSQGRFSEIGFHFTNGMYYDWNTYCRGVRLVSAAGRDELRRTEPPSENTHQSLRAYLDIVFAFAGTVSLCKELKPADELAVGTVIIYPGSPGHCCIIVDRKVMNEKDTVYKLVEGYMPAQSIYVLANPYEPGISPWYHLSKTKIATASCLFNSFYLKKFE